MKNQNVPYTTKKAWKTQFANSWFARGFVDAREGRPWYEYTMEDCEKLCSDDLEEWQILHTIQRYYEYGRYWGALGLEWPLGPGGGLRRWVMATIKEHWADILVPGANA